MSATANLGLQYLSAAMSGKENAVNAGWDVLDAITIRKTGDTFTGPVKIARTAVSSGSPNPSLWVLTPADTNLTASTEAVSTLFDLSAIRQFATGALATQRAVRIVAPTYAFVGASTITTAATLSISGAPIAGTNATITTPWALNVESGNVNVAGSVTAGSAVVKGISTITVTDAGTTNEPNVLTLQHRTSGTPGVSFGNALLFQADNSTNTLTDQLSVNTGWSSATAGSETALVIWFIRRAGVDTEVLRLTGAGNGRLQCAQDFFHANAAGAIGVFGITPVTQQANASQAAITAVTDANAKSALQAIYNALKNYGWCPATA